MKLTPSVEQQAIIDRIQDPISLKVNAVAGSGKTHVVLFIAEQYPDKSILQITYNAALKMEVRQKKTAYGLKNLRIHNYHSLFYYYYRQKVFDDESLQKVLQNRNIHLNSRKLSDFEIDILIIDELQDMTPLYFEAILCFLTDLEHLGHHLPKFILMGDEKQAIYNFMEADPRFLTLSEIVWGLEVPVFDLPLHTSFRVTQPIAAFINSYMIQENLILAPKTGPKVDYIFSNNFAPYQILDFLRLELEDLSRNPGDIFILAGSLRSEKSPIKKLENLLVEYSDAGEFNRPIPVYCSVDDDDKTLDEKVIEGKVVFSTIHKAKGRERPIVIVYGFDNSYFKYYAKEKPSDRCPSELYVACTRASERLILVHHYKNPPLPFLSLDYTDLPTKEINFHFFDDMNFQPLPSDEERPDVRSRSVKELTRFLSYSIVDQIVTLLEPWMNSSKKKSPYKTKRFKTVSIPSTKRFQNNLTEEVSEINGVVIPAMYEASEGNDKISHMEFLLSILQEKLDQLDVPEFLHRFIENLPHPLKTLADYLNAGTVYVAYANRIFHKLIQIPTFDWLTGPMIEICHYNLNQVVEKGANYEIPIRGVYEQDKHILKINGIMDADDGNTIWEFKCVDKLTLEHKVQLLGYAYLWHQSKEFEDGKRDFCLFNIRNGELWYLHPEALFWNRITSIINILSERVFDTNPQKSDTEFLKGVKIFKQNYGFLK